jgi:hypothetical protein
MTGTNPTLDWLENQTAWYSQKSTQYQRVYKRAKAVEIVVAALIPLGSALSMGTVVISGITLNPGAIIIGLFGVVITVIEGLLHLNQYQQNWITYRATAEALKHEKYLYLATAGPYANVQVPLTVLAERIVLIMSQENSQWATAQASPTTVQSGVTPPATPPVTPPATPPVTPTTE